MKSRPPQDGALGPEDISAIRTIIAEMANPGNHDRFIAELMLHAGRLRRELACDTQGNLSEKNQSDLAILKKAQAIIYDYCCQNTWPYYPGMASHEELFNQRWNGAPRNAQEQEAWEKTFDLQRVSIAAHRPLGELINYLASMKSNGARGRKEIDAKINSFITAVAMLFDRLIARPTTTTTGPFYALVSVLLNAVGLRSFDPRRRVERAVRSLKKSRQS